MVSCYLSLKYSLKLIKTYKKEIIFKVDFVVKSFNGSVIEIVVNIQIT